MRGRISCSSRWATLLSFSLPFSLYPAVTHPPPAASRGATLPYVEYEAENASYTGTLIGPSTSLGDMAAEASGRKAVKLTATGQHVTFTATQPANSIVVRYSIPDSATGTGINATLSIYVNGVFQQKLPVTSRYSWAYDRLAYQNPKVPNAATAHHFYDEAHTLLKQVSAGATVTIQEDADDTAPYYVIDLIDLEQVGPPIPQPAGSLSITDCGADPSDANDSSANIQNCINMAESRGKVLYIPQGTFKTLGGRLKANNVTIQGAGMWYSTLSGIGAGFHCGGGNCTFLDFALLGDATFRSDTNKTGGFDGTSGLGSVIDGVWVEHANNGYWVGHNTNGLIVRNSRVRDTFADGVNFNCGTTNSIVENTELRYTGDNGTGVSSRASCGNGPTTNNTFKFNTVQLPWNAQCFNVFGGGDNTFEDNLCYDSIIEPGFLVAQAFNTTPFTGTTSILRTTLIRAGGPFGGSKGALTIQPREAPLAAGNILIQNLDIENATFSGIEFRGPFAMGNVSLDSITVSGAGTWGVQVEDTASGSATVSGVVVTNAASGGLNNAAGSAFNIIRGPGNVGW
jgi:Pectate lyase superfamily protein